MIQRYTTPYHDFLLPFTVDKVSKLYLTYSQNGENLIEKVYSADGSETSPETTLINALELLNNSSMGDEYTEAINQTSQNLSRCSILTVHLTQEDTAQLQTYSAEERNIALMQIRIKTPKGNVYSSLPTRDRVYRTFKEEVI